MGLPRYADALRSGWPGSNVAAASHDETRAGAGPPPQGLSGRRTSSDAFRPARAIFMRAVPSMHLWP